MDVNCDFNNMIYNDFFYFDFLHKLKPPGQPSGFFSGFQGLGAETASLVYISIDVAPPSAAATKSHV